MAYLEEDGLLLAIGLLAAVLVLTVALVAVWETVLGAKWIIGLCPSNGGFRATLFQIGASGVT